MRVRLFILLISCTTYSSGQTNQSIQEMDSFLRCTPGIENYRYWYGGNSHSIIEFSMDTLQGKLTRVRYTSWGTDTIGVDYLFMDNFLVKVQSFKIKRRDTLPVGKYYFKNNKLIHKSGKNYRQYATEIFGKISPGHFPGQLEYIYYQYEYLNPSKTRFQDKIPGELKLQRIKIDKNNSFHQ